MFYFYGHFRQTQARQYYPKSGTFSGLRLHKYFPAVFLNNFIGHQKSQAAATQTFGREKRCKYLGTG